MSLLKFQVYCVYNIVIVLTIQNTYRNTKSANGSKLTFKSDLHINLCITQSLQCLKPWNDHTVPIKHLGSKQCINIEAIPPNHTI